MKFLRSSFITPEWSIKKCIFIKLFITWYTTVANRRYRYHVENSKVESSKFQVKESGRKQWARYVMLIKKIVPHYILKHLHAYGVLCIRPFYRFPSAIQPSIWMIRRSAFYRLRYLLVRMAILWLNFCSCYRNSAVKKEWTWICATQTT